MHDADAVPHAGKTEGLSEQFDCNIDYLAPSLSRGIPFSHTCSRLQFSAKLDYLMIGASGYLSAATEEFLKEGL